MAIFYSARICLPAIASIALALSGCAGTSNWFSSKSSLDLQNPVAVYLPHAKLHEQSGNLDEARKSYGIVLSEDPKSVEAILGLARIDHLAGRFQEAEQGFLKALKIAPNNPNVLYSAGQHYASQERWTESVDLLNRAMQADPNNNTIRHHLALALTKSGNIEAARPHFLRTVGDAEADYNIGYILYEQGEIEAAEHYFLQAVIKNPQLSNAQYWVDEIRREKEAGLMLASGTRTNPRYEELSPPPRNNANISANRRFPQGTALNPRPRMTQSQIPNSVQQAGHNARPQINSNRKPNLGHLVQPQSSQPLQAAPAGNLTPQQIEQLQNQMQQ